MKIICVGRNYADHVSELANERPSEPVLFLKTDTSVILKNFPFVIPEFSKNVHYEVELLIKINKVGKYIDAAFASKYYDEIGLGIDFTARDVQDNLKAKGLPWEKAKAFDGSAFISEFIPKSTFANLSDIAFSLFQNGTLVQQGNTQQMLWNINELIAYISQYFTLKKGDIIFTGTPQGVGKVNENDVLEGYLAQQKMFELKIK